MTNRITVQDLKRFYGVTGVMDMANDAAPIPSLPSVTMPNSGIPFMFSTWNNPTVIKAIITPIKSEEVYGNAQKGDWTTDTAQFPFVELSGETAAYGDFSQDGTTDPNVNWEQRQSFHTQTWTKWGELEVEKMGAAKVDWVNQKNLASISVLNKTINRINCFGVSGLRLFGALNDPSLPASIAPKPKMGMDGKPAAGNTWMDVSDSIQIIADIQLMFQTLVNQMGGNVEADSTMTLVIPTERSVVLTYINQYDVRLSDWLKTSFPNLKVKTLPEAGAMLSGGMSKITQAQLFIDEVEGQETRTTAFTEKLRAHTVERYSSNIRQKKSSGTWGTIWYYPVAVVTMAGI